MIVKGVKAIIDYHAPFDQFCCYSQISPGLIFSKAYLIYFFLLIGVEGLGGGGGGCYRNNDMLYKVTSTVGSS